MDGKNRILLLLVMVLTLSAYKLDARLFQLIEETPNNIKFKFNLPEWNFMPIEKNNIMWQQLYADGGEIFAKEGYPLLLSFSHALGIPIDGFVSVTIEYQKSDVYRNILLIQADKLETDNTEVSYSFYQDVKAYNSNELYPKTIVEAGNSAFIGNRHTVPIRILPFQYNARNRELLVTSEAIINIQIHGDKNTVRVGEFTENYIDQVADEFFLNNRTSRFWRKSKELTENIFNIRNNNTAVNELQLVIDTEGIYKITYSYLQEKMNNLSDSLGIQFAWSLTNVDPRYLELRDENGPVAIHFNGESDGVFNKMDYFEFFGDRHYGETRYFDDYTTENVYTLYLKETLGARLAVENGGLTNSVSSQYIVPDAFEQTIHLEQQIIPDKLGRSWSLNTDFYREDNWFWKKITAPNLEILPFTLQYPKDSTLRSFKAKVTLMGLTYYEYLPQNQYDHKATVRLNQALINTISWRDQTEAFFENLQPLPNSYLNHGSNFFYISLNGDTPMGDREQVLLDYIDLTYWREYKTSEDFIKFTKPSHRPFFLYQFNLEGFSNNQVSVYKIGSSIFNNLQIEPFTIDGGAPWTVTFQDNVISDDVVYYAVTEDKKKIPKAIRANIPSNLKSVDNSAECLIITIKEFISDPGTMLFKQLWEQRGYQVQVIDLQDIFDEFNYGIRSAESIKDFITFAYNNWAEPQLKSVLFLGDGTDDERDSSSSNKFNIIPVKKLWTYKHGATACDNWYGCVVGTDPIPDVSISRINVWKADQILPIAQKSHRYLNEPNYDKLWHSNVTLTSGGKSSDGSDIFSQQSEYIRRNKIPNFYRVSRVYTNTQTVSHDFWGLTPQLISKINDGTVFLQFMGHGGGRIWADYNLFNFGNVASLTNQNYAIVSSLACYCSAFDTKGSASISETFVMQPNKGAIATIGFSGLGYLYDDVNYGLALTEGILAKDFDTLGEAYNYAKARFYVSTSSVSAQIALIQGGVLLGDHNIKVIKPQSGVVVNTDKDVYAVNDTIRVTATFPAPVNAARTYIMKQTETVVNPPNELPVTPNGYAYSYNITGNVNDKYYRKIYVAGHSNTGEYYGFKDIAVGKGLLTNMGSVPQIPTWNDSIRFQVKVTGIDNMATLNCRVRLDSISTNPTWFSFPMIPSGNDDNVYITQNALSSQVTGKEVFFKYRAVLSNNNTVESFLNSLVVAGPELLLSDMQFISDNNNLGVKVQIKNIGNARSGETTIRLYATQTGLPTQLIKTEVFAPLEIDEVRWVTMSIDSVFTNNVLFEARVNIPRMFPEWSVFNNNNIMTLSVQMNYHTIPSGGGVISSIDNNLICEIPPNLSPLNQTSMFRIETLDTVHAKNQPDVTSVLLRNGSSSLPYLISTLNSEIIDSNGVFINGKKLKLTFNYHQTDSQTQLHENDDSYKIYKWEPLFFKWILQGGNISSTEDKVVFEVNRQGIYTLMRNQDNNRPSIDVNVQDQEFTVGGYISGKGTISIILSDANGIDVFDNSIKLHLDGTLVPDVNWVKTINQNDINRIPIKYQLNLPKGIYSLVVDCKDVNGNFSTRTISFIVNDRFDVINIANYPNPVLGNTNKPNNAGRTRFTYVLTDDADEVSIKVYTVSGRLVKTFDNLPTGVGYHEYPRTVYAWDCIDKHGFYLANGVYFYKIIAKKGNKTIEKIQKMAILK